MVEVEEEVYWPLYCYTLKFVSFVFVVLQLALDFFCRFSVWSFVLKLLYLLYCTVLSV